MRNLLVTILFFFGLGFSNCSNDDCGNISSPPYFDIQSIAELNHFRNVENSVENISEELTVQLEEYAGLSIEFDVEYISFRQDIFDFSLMNSLLACTPIPH